MSRRETAISFLKLAASGKVAEAYERYVSPKFFHHNPYFPSDRESLKRGMEESSASHPNKMFNIERTLEDGDLVAVHSHLQQKSMDMAVVHILRFEGDQIVEMWDIGQPVPKDSPNERGMF